MSTTLNSADHSVPTQTFGGIDEIEYRPMPAVAPISLALGIFSITGLLSVYALGVCAVAVMFSAFAFRRIVTSEEKLSGRYVCLLGFLLSLGFLISGSSLHAYMYIAEVPEGYERLSFAWLSKQSPAMVDGELQINPEAEQLNGQKVYIKGYMYPENQQTGITRFVMCKDTGDCCFGGQPKITDMILIEFREGVTAEYRDKQLVGVAGVLRVEKRVKAGQVFAIYSVEGDHFRG